MKARLVKIGNSRGIRLPKAVIDQVGLTDDVELTVEGQRVVIEADRPPRTGWAEAASKVALERGGLLESGDRHTLRRERMAVVKTRPPRRGEVHLVGLDPTRGREMKKTRPCVVVSPDELNAHLGTVIVAPLTSAGTEYPFRVPCRFEGKPGLVVLDQVRTVNRERLLRRLGTLSTPSLESALSVLREMFEP